MTAQIIDGKTIAANIRKDIAKIISEKINQGRRPPGLAVILVGNDPASNIYVRNKRQACEEAGVQSFYHPLPLHTSQNTLLSLITNLNQDPLVDCILLQLPLPSHLNTD